jgi:hypothetical protein
MYNAFYIEGKAENTANYEEGLSIPVSLHREVAWREGYQIVLPRNEEETTIQAPIYDSAANPLLSD